MLPEDLYSQWYRNCGTGIENWTKHTGYAGGGILTSSNKHRIQDDVRFYQVINSAMEKGFRQVFRRMPARISDYRLLCQSLDSNAIGVHRGRTLSGIMKEMRLGKSDWDNEDRQGINDRGGARDSAFRLMYVLLQGKLGITEGRPGDKNMAYNATEFVVSHSLILWPRIRKIVREAFEERFTLSYKQRKQLDKWPIPVIGEEEGEEDDQTTEEEDEYLYFGSDVSF